MMNGKLNSKINWSNNSRLMIISSRPIRVVLRLFSKTKRMFFKLLRLVSRQILLFKISRMSLKWKQFWCNFLKFILIFQKCCLVLVWNTKLLISYIMNRLIKRISINFKMFLQAEYWKFLIFQILKMKKIKKTSKWVLVHYSWWLLSLQKKGVFKSL